MKIERLPPEWYGELAAVDDGFIPPAGQSLVFVARDDAGKIVGRNVVLLLPHVEGTWVATEYRGSTLMPRLMDAAEQELAKAGASAVFAYSVSDVNSDYLKRMGYEELPWKVFRKQVKQ